MQSDLPYTLLVRRGLDQAARGTVDGATFGQLYALGRNGSWSAQGYAVVRPEGDTRLVLHGPGGRIAVLDAASGHVRSYHQSALTVPEPVVLVPDRPQRFEGPEVMDRLLPIVAIVFGAITLISLGQPLVRAWVKRLERRWSTQQAPTTPEVTARFDRLEQAVEAVAIEVERIGEAQRYQTRMFAERAPAALPAEGGDAAPPRREGQRVRTPPEGVAR